MDKFLGQTKRVEMAILGMQPPHPFEGRRLRLVFMAEYVQPKAEARVGSPRNVFALREPESTSTCAHLVRMVMAKGVAAGLMLALPYATNGGVWRTAVAMLLPAIQCFSSSCVLWLQVQSACRATGIARLRRGDGGIITASLKSRTSAGCFKLHRY